VSTNKINKLWKYYGAKSQALKICDAVNKYHNFYRQSNVVMIQ
jgi:hypothetical protein